MKENTTEGKTKNQSASYCPTTLHTTLFRSAISHSPTMRKPCLREYAERMSRSTRQSTTPKNQRFDNTLIREDEVEGRKHYYDLLSRVESVFFNMLSADTSDEMDALAQKMSPILTKHANDVSLNPQLFARIKAVHDHHRELTPEENKLLEESYDGFVRSGALLDEKGKEKLRQLTEEASMLALQFSQNLLKENKAYTLHIDDPKQLEGLPETVREAAATTAKEQGLDGWTFTLDAPSYGPFMMYSTQRELRKQLYMARNTMCIKNNEENNLDICKRLVNLRREMAQLLGYETYADFVMKYRMASNVKNVYRLLDDLIEAYKPTAIEELGEIKSLAQKREGSDFRLMPWDTAYYAHQLKLEKYDLDPEMLRPYFEVNNVIKGVFGLATRLYGITFKENGDIPVYHSDVKAYEVFDKDGSYLAVLYVDFFPRKGKRDGAWMTEYQGQRITREGENIRPHASLVMNFSKPTDDKPALLRLGEVETLPPRVRTLAPRHVRQHPFREPVGNKRLVGLRGTPLTVHGKLRSGEGFPAHIRLPLPDRRADARRTHRQNHS